MREKRSPSAQGGKDHPPDKQPPVVPVSRLLGEGTSLRLEHRGAIYRLRITRNGKLILTK